MGGNKGGNSTSSTVTIPPEVLARYNAVNANAENVAATPFQSYSGQFVAPLTATQQSGISNTNAAANQAQPSFQQAQGLTAASAYNVNPSQINASSINQYMSPYLQDVVGSESALLNQNNQQQQSGQMGTAITSGAFGGDRSGIAAANLNQQQNLANANIYSGLLNTGYNNALSTAQQQQGVDLSAQQSNRANLQNVAQQYAGLGAAAQSSALQGAQAQLSAGQQEQQTAQAQDSALYNQFLQQQSYPFQTAQFLANIAEGTGVNSGSTTTTNASQDGIFSDERLKQDVRPVGETYDGQKIYTYKYKGHPQTHMGLMAQEVEGKHPDAVGLAAGYKTVNYDKATDKAADRGHFADGGLAYGGGGGFDPGLAGQMLANYQAMYAPLLGGAGGLGGAGRVPSTGGGNYHLQAAPQANVQQQPGLAQQVNQFAQAGDNIGKLGNSLGAWHYGQQPQSADGSGPGSAKWTAQAKAQNAKDSAILGDVNLPSSVDLPLDTSAPGVSATDFSGSDASATDFSGADASATDFSGLYQRGGRIARASGGDLPYVSDQSMSGMDIPDEQNSYQLKPAQGSGGSAGGGGGGLGSLMSGAGSLISGVSDIIPFLQAGGRVGRADGGSVDDGEGDPILKAIRLSTNPFYQFQVQQAAEHADDMGEDAEAPASNDDTQAQTQDQDSQSVVPAGLSAAPPKSMGTITKGGHVDPEVVSFFKNRGLSDQVALGIAAGINAESGNNPNVVNPKSGAMGLGQWMGDRQKGLLAQYGPNPSKSEQLNYLWHELKGGDRGGPAVLAANDAPTALGLYVTKFMRPKAGSETEGDLARGLGAIRSGYADGGSLSLPGDPDPSLPGDPGPSLPGDPDMAATDSAFDASFPTKKHGLDLSNYVDPTDTAPLSSAPMPAPSDTPNASRLGATLASTNGAAPDASAPIGGDQQSHGFFHNLFHSTPGSDDHTNAVLSALSGLAGMATAPTRNIGYALASGLQSGVGTYQGLRNYENVNLAQVGINRMNAQAGATGARAEALAHLQDAQAKSIGNAQAQLQFAMLARSYLSAGIVTPEDLQHISAPISAPTLSDITPNVGAPSPSGVTVPPAPAPSNATNGITATPQTLAQAYPSLANVQPQAAPKAPVTIKTPFDNPVNPGDGMAKQFYQSNPDWQQYQSLTSQADDMAAKLSPALAMTPYGQGMAKQIEQLRAQASSHRSNAEDQYDTQVGPNVAAVRQKANDLTNFADSRYQQIINATQSAAQAAATTNLNTDSSLWGKAWGKLASAGIPVPDSAKDLQGSAEISERNRAIMNAFNVGNTGISARAEGTELNALNKYGTNDPGPASGYDTAVKTRALADQRYQYAQDFASAAKTISNEPEWTMKWLASHPLEGYVHDTVQNTPWAKGMTSSQIASYLPVIQDKNALNAAVTNGDNYVNVNGIPHKVNRTNGGYRLTPWESK